MAASIVRSRASLIFHKMSLKPFIRCLSSGSYYVLLPEIPPDTAETNSLMRVGQLPQFSQVTPDNVVMGCAKLAIEYETRFDSHMEKLQDQQIPKTFESVFEHIEKISVPMNYAWRTAKFLSYVKGSGNDGFREAFQRVHSQIQQANNERWISEILYYAVKEVYADKANLNDFQRRLVELYLLEGRLNGIELIGEKKQTFIATLNRLANEKTNFRNKVMISGGLFSHRIDDFSVVKDLPQSLAVLMAEDRFNPARGPWKVTLQPDIYSGFMEHCSDRALRWNVWQAYNNRASARHGDHNLGNHKLIEEIRMFRRDLADNLGYENFAQMSMETKMAGKVENVLNMLEIFKNKFLPVAHEEIGNLQEFAGSEGFNDTLQSWDISYWRNRQHKHLSGLDSDEIAQYFPLPNVLNGLFKLCHQLFAITVKLRESSDELENVWIYDVFDENGEFVSCFYFDPYARPSEKRGGAWMEMGREKSLLYGVYPFSYLVLNLQPPILKDRPALLTIKDVASLFFQFGHGLQQMLTTVPYSEIAGQRNVEWDAIHICAMFLQQWVYVPETLRSISSHLETGQTLPDSDISNIITAKNHMCAYDTMFQLYLSAFDMEMHISKQHWNDAMKLTWEDYMPIPFSDDYNQPCSFTHIFSEQYPAAYYSYKWSEMIAADVFDAFQEVGLDNTEAVSAIGRRFRDTFLSLGGGVSAGEVFRHFRGRDPSLDALLVQKGIK